MNLKLIVKKLPINELTYMASDVLIKAIAFVSMPFFLSYMSPAEFGEFSSYQSIIGILVIVFGLNICNGIVRYCVEKKESEKYLTTALWLTLLTSGIASAIILLIYFFSDYIKYSLNVVILILICTTANCVYLLGLEIIRSTGNAKRYGISGVCYSIISTVLGLALVANLKNDLAFWRLLSIAAANIIMGTIWTIRLIKNDGIKYNNQTAKYLMHYSIPLIPYTLSTTILVQANRLFLTKVGYDAVGIYSFASNMALLIYVVALALNRSLQYDMFTALRDKKDYSKKVYINLGLFYAIYIILIFGTNILIGIFGNKDYYGAVKAIPILELGYGFSYFFSITSNFIYYYKRNIALSGFSIISALSLCVINIFIIPKLGYIGAALSMAISYFVLLVLIYSYTLFKLKIKPVKHKYAFLFLMALIAPVIIKTLVIG